MAGWRTSLGIPPTLALLRQNTVLADGPATGSGPQCRPRPSDQPVVLGARRRQVEEARREVAVAPRGGELVVVLQDGGAELVVVRVVALEEDHAPAGVDQGLGVVAGLEVGQRLARRGGAVVAGVGEDLGNRAVRLLRLDRLELVHADRLFVRV